MQDRPPVWRDAKALGGGLVRGYMGVTAAMAAEETTAAGARERELQDAARRARDKARWAASGCNYQPWEASIVTGQALKDLQAKIIANGPGAAEYDWAAPGQEEAYKTRLDGVSAGMFGAMGIARDDGAGRMAAMAKNAALTIHVDAKVPRFASFAAIRSSRRRRTMMKATSSETPTPPSSTQWLPVV